ncbi:MAG TPA: S1C family serine protease [Candidatus Mediterraneibacter intestinavium]|nr:S1C family serine protease [Candidatus Mediterraneibacter intestinavium]
MPYDKDQNLAPEEAPENRDGQGKDRLEDSRAEERYSFLQETIKPEPISREKLLRQFVRIAVYGVILGVFACLGFFALRPWAEGWFHKDPETVTIPEDEEPVEDQAEEETEGLQDPVLDAESYAEINDSLYILAQEAEKGVVTVSRAAAEEDWNEVATGIRTSVTGVITADNGQELLILADDALCSDAERWMVTFADGSEHTASLKRQDANSGFAVFSVARSEIAETTWNTIKVSELGNSNAVRQGDTVIALGNMYGYDRGIGYGVISSCDHKETFYDGEWDVLATDIPISTDGTGVLFNLDGEVIGMISASIWKEKGSGAANAYAISDIKSTIELLANGERVPYAGIHGTTVTKSIQDSQGIPAGVYVIDVDTDSPAMQAGIQSGDVITQINGKEVGSIMSYRQVLLETTADGQVSITGQRQGADGYVEIDFNVTIGSKG